VRSEPARKSHLRWFLYVSGPSILVIAPLLGLPFFSDQRVDLYRMYSLYKANPLYIIPQVYLDINYEISRGMFRPIGRIIQYFEQSAMFDVATATGLPPYIIQGAIRLVMIALLSCTATYFISALYRSARLGIQTTAAPAAASDNATPPPISKDYRHSTAPVEIFPFLFAACLIITGGQHSISFFPFLFISIAIAMLAIPLYIASHTALSRTRIKIREVVATVLLGAAVAAFHDLLYILPLVCLVVLLLRGWIMGITARGILRTNAFLRYLTFSCGFLTVFIPARIAIYSTCERQSENIIEGCQVTTELALSGSVVPLWIGRAFSGLPWERLVLILRGDLDAGLAPRGLMGLLSNTWTIIVIALILLLALRAGHHLIHKQPQSYRSDTPQKDNSSTELKVAERRVGAALIIIGVTLIGSSSLLVSATTNLQEWHELGWGLDPFRDTLLVQIGWALALFGALHLLFLTLQKSKVLRIPSGLTNRSRTNRSRYLLIAGSAALLFGLTVLTFVANDRYALTRRRDPESNIHNLIAVAAVDFDNTERGQHIRCQLLDTFNERVGSGVYATDKILRRELNRLARSEYGAEFCPTPP